MKNSRKIPTVSNEVVMEKIFQLLSNKKAQDIKILDVRGITSLFDYIILCNGTSSVHCRSIYRDLRVELKKLDHLPFGEDGKDSGQWIAMDYIDFIVHIFEPEMRSYYDLEGIWGDAPELSY